MAHLKPAVNSLSKLTGVPAAVLTTRAHPMRTARLLPVEGRGFNAANLNARHLARLVIATMLPTVKGKDVVALVRCFERIKAVAAWEKMDGLVGQMTDEQLKAISKLKTFGDAVEWLIKTPNDPDSALFNRWTLSDLSIWIGPKVLEGSVRVYDTQNDNKLVQIVFRGPPVKKVKVLPVAGLTLGASVPGHLFYDLSKLVDEVTA